MLRWSPAEAGRPGSSREAPGGAAAPGICFAELATSLEFEGVVGHVLEIDVAGAKMYFQGTFLSYKALTSRNVLRSFM